MPQTRTLILIRHAKSAWGLDLDDRERPLSKRGRHDAAALGAFLATRKLGADLVWCSTAVRAGQTWDHASAAGAKASVRRDDERIYEAVVDELIQVLRGTADEHRTVIMVGHSPAIPDLVDTLALRPDSGDRQRDRWRRLDTKYPTSGCAVLGFDGDWSTLRPGSAMLESFDVPRAGEPIPAGPSRKKDDKVKAKAGKSSSDKSKKSRGKKG